MCCIRYSYRRVLVGSYFIDVQDAGPPCPWSSLRSSARGLGRRACGAPPLAPPASMSSKPCSSYLPVMYGHDISVPSVRPFLSPRVKSQIANFLLQIPQTANSIVARSDLHVTAVMKLLHSPQAAPELAGPMSAWSARQEGAMERLIGRSSSVSPRSGCVGKFYGVHHQR